MILILILYIDTNKRIIPFGLIKTAYPKYNINTQQLNNPLSNLHYHAAELVVEHRLVVVAQVGADSIEVVAVGNIVAVVVAELDSTVVVVVEDTLQCRYNSHLGMEEEHLDVDTICKRLKQLTLKRKKKSNITHMQNKYIPHMQVYIQIFFLFLCFLLLVNQLKEYHIIFQSQYC